jgi:chromosome segregation ATPase
LVDDLATVLHKYKTLQGENARLRTEALTSSSETGTRLLHEKINLLRNDKVSLNQNIAALKTENTTSKSDYNLLISKYSDVAAAERYHAERLTEWDAWAYDKCDEGRQLGVKVKTLESEVETSGGEIERLEDEVETLEGKVEMLEGEVKSAKQKFETFKQRIDAVKNEF